MHKPRQTVALDPTHPETIDYGLDAGGAGEGGEGAAGGSEEEASLQVCVCV